MKTRSVGILIFDEVEVLDLLRDVAPGATVCNDRRVVDNGRVITSAGVAAGIDMAFHVVARLLGTDIAQQAARYIEYPWQPEA